MADKKNNPVWTQRDNETATAYQGFCVYRDMGQERSIDKAWRKHWKPENSQREASGHWRKWCRENKWLHRAQAYDAFLDEARREAEVEKWRKRGEALAEKQFELSEALMEKATFMLKFPLEKRTVKVDKDGNETTVIHPARWNLGTAAFTAKAGVELGRLAVGLPTKTEQLEISGPGGGPIHTKHEKVDPNLEADLEALKEKSPAEIHDWFMQTVVKPVIGSRNGTS